MKCKWCHNPEAIAHQPEVYFYQPNCMDCGSCEGKCPTDALTRLGPKIYRIDRGLCIGCLQCVEACSWGSLVLIGKVVTVDEVLREVARDADFYRNSGGGMTLSGGEPLAQPNFTLALLKEAKDSGYHTALDTSGNARWEAIERILEYTDLVLYDIKNMDPEAHRKFSGVPNDLILDNARRVAKRVRLRIRVPLIPGVNDSIENLEETAKFAKSLEPEGVDLLPFHPFAGTKYRLFGIEYPFPINEDYVEEKLEEVKKIFLAQSLEITIGG